MDLLDKLGIDWKLLLAQLFNFSILLVVLYRFLYRPILRKLEERRRQIELNAEKTKELEEKLGEAEKIYEKRRLEAEKKAEEILAEAAAEAKREREEILVRAEADARGVLREAKEAAERERERIFQDVRQESEALVRDAVERVLRSVADEKTAEALLSKAEKTITGI